MCGLSGIFSLNRSVKTIDFVRAHATLAHRGPDDNGILHISPECRIKTKLRRDSRGDFWCEELNGVSNAKVMLAHHRLSILDLSSHGHQPMQHENWTILFNGEIYNYIELRNELLGLGHQFNTDTDTEVLLKAWAEWGEKALDRLNGMWAFCIYDQVEERLFLSRDRFGEKPLYWSTHHQTLYFASELKFFKTLIPLNLNEARADDYLLRCQIDHTDETLFSGVFQVKPGTLLTFDLGSLRYREFRYWNLPECSVASTRSFGDTCDEFSQLMQSAILMRLRSDVPVGLLLSGGLDSSAIAGILNDSDSVSTIHSYSAVFTDKRFSEQENIEFALHRNRKLESKFISYGPEEALERLPQMLWTQDHPVRSLASFSQYRLHQSIRSDAKVGVVLSGQGADELFAGYSRYNQLYLVSLLLKGQLYRFASEWDALHQYDGLSMSAIGQNLIRSVYSLVKARKIGQVVAQGLYFWQKEQLFGSALPEYLRYEDRNSMAASVESRLPFLDHRLAEFAMTLPDSFKVEKGVRKRLMRSALSDTVPQEIVADRVKKGFVSPQLAWQQTEPMSQWLNDNYDVPSFVKHSKKNHIDPWFRWRVACFNQWRSIFGV